MKDNKTIENLAKEYLNIETLETKGSDYEDFHEVSVWSLKAALEAAYEAGKNAQATKKEKRPRKTAGSLTD